MNQDEIAFQKISNTAERMLAGLPDVDLQTIMDSMGTYSVCLDLDHLRQNQSVLTDKMCEIQAKRDELHTRTLYLCPLYFSMKSASDYYCDAGIVCSLASSKEKRVAEIKIRIPEFWKRYSDVIRTKEIIEKTALHLDRQYECISRLITGFQMKNQVKEISRGEMPFTLRSEEIPGYSESIPVASFCPAVPQVETSKTMTDEELFSPVKTPTVVAPTTAADDDLINRQMSQPLTTTKNFQNLESFGTGQPKVTSKSTIVTGTREVEW